MEKNKCCLNAQDSHLNVITWICSNAQDSHLNTVRWIHSNAQDSHLNVVRWTCLNTEVSHLNTSLRDMFKCSNHLGHLNIQTHWLKITWYGGCSCLHFLLFP